MVLIEAANSLCFMHETSAPRLISLWKTPQRGRVFQHVKPLLDLSVLSSFPAQLCKNYKQSADASGCTLAGRRTSCVREHKNKDGSGCASDFRDGANVKQDVASAVVETPAFFTHPRLWRV